MACFAACWSYTRAIFSGLLALDLTANCPCNLDDGGKVLLPPSGDHPQTTTALLFPEAQLAVSRLGAKDHRIRATWTWWILRLRIVDYLRFGLDDSTVRIFVDSGRSEPSQARD